MMAVHTIYYRLSLCAILLATCLHVGRAQSLDVQVDHYVAPYMQTGNFSGSILIARDGEVLLSKGYGSANTTNGIPNTPQTVYHLASVSRVFTSAAILLLEQQGKLRVDAPLSTYLPDWPRGDEITVHHLLTLSSGMPNINTLPGYIRWQTMPQTPKTLVDKFRDLPLEFEPGMRTVHSNSNYNILALLIETVSGLSYGAYLENHLLAPLGMSQTGHHGDAQQVIPHQATGYAPVGLADVVPALVIDWSVKTGNGSMYATTEDLLRLDRALAHHTLLGEEAVNKLFREYFPRNGYGWYIEERFDTQVVYINGGSPGFGSYWGRAVGPDVTVIVLGNMYNNVPNTIGRDLMALVLGENTTAPTIQADPPDAELLASLSGSYAFGPDFYRPNGVVTFSVQDGHLFNGMHWVMPTLTNPLHFVHRRYWSDLVFIRDAAGHITELHYDGYVGKKQ